MTTTGKTREALADLFRQYAIKATTSGANTVNYVDEALRLATNATTEVVATKNPAGAIVAVTRQDAEGRVIEVIAEAAPSQQSAEVQALPCAIGARVEGARVIVTASGGNDGARRLCAAIVAMIEADTKGKA